MGKRDIKVRNKQIKIVVIVTVIILATMSIGYAAFNTNLSINAKGNVTTKKITAEELKELAVTTGDGLYADGYDIGNENYRYRGTNPDNYIQFNNELWRIISLESDGTLKIMKKDSITTKEWDTTASNNWARPSTLNTFLNEEYYPTLSTEAKALMTKHDFAVGPVANYTQNINLYEQIDSEKTVLWNGYVGLVNVSDVLRSNSNGAQCAHLSQNQANKDLCKTTRYILPATDEEMWTISQNDGTNYAFGVYISGNISNAVTNKGIYGIYPVVYLDVGWKLTGTGTETDPYIIH